MKCLVTGGAGFIGSHLTDKLIEMGFDVTVVDDLSTGNIKNVNPRAKFVSNTVKYCLVGDSADNIVRVPSVTNNNIIIEMIRSKKYNYIFHLAATASVPLTIKHPISSNENNIDLTLRMLNATKKDQPQFKKFIFASSSAVYGNPKNETGMSETDAVDPMSPYALQKYTAEQYCELYRKLYNVPTVSLRFFNVYGPRQNGSGPYANVISSWATKLVNNEKICMHGDGTQQRDFIHVNDVVDLIIQAAMEDEISGVYNIGTGQTQSILDILHMFEKHFENIQLDNQPARLGDPIKTVADTTKLFNKFGQKHFKNFATSLSQTIEFYKE